MKSSILIALFISIGIFISKKIQPVDFSFQKFEMEVGNEFAPDFSKTTNFRNSEISAHTKNSIHQLDLIFQFIKIVIGPIILVVSLMWIMMTLGFFQSLRKTN